MAEGKGYNVIAKINLPPEESYHSGHSVIVQGDTVGQVQDHLANLIAEGGALDDNVQEQARFILLRFAEYALGGAAEQALTSGVEGTTQGGEGAGSTSSDVAEGQDAVSTTAVAPDLASAAVLKAVAKKTGKTVEELGELTVADAQALLKGGK